MIAFLNKSTALWQIEANLFPPLVRDHGEGRRAHWVARCDVGVSSSDSPAPPLQPGG